MEIEIITPYKRPLRERVKSRIRNTYSFDTSFWRMALGGLWLVGCYMFMISALGIPTGIGSFFDILVCITLGTIGLSISANLIALVLALIGLPVPRLFVGSIIYYLSIYYYIFWYADSGVVVSVVISVIITLFSVLLGVVIGTLTSNIISRRLKVALLSTLTALSLLVSMVSFTQSPDTSSVLGDVIDSSADYVSGEEGPADTDSASNTNQLLTNYTNPSEVGEYNYNYFTYSNGVDLHREGFGEDTDLISTSVDASSYIEKWSSLRTKFWGFDETALPLNGRVWMPEGEGPFPLVLIVHGNHLMEDFSDDGYGYIGELLASKGLIAVSVDENFLNYSVWSDIPNDDFKVRAWVLLKHLQQIKDFSESGNNLFSNKVDLNQIALIGHSRGGQAVSMVADANRWFSTDASIQEDLDQFHIQSVIAIAPTDSSVDKTRAELKDVNYLVLQGAKDGDVNEYYGERQYDRTTFSPGKNLFKTYLHIYGANHSQFNTSWGTIDLSYPSGLLLNSTGLMDGEEQREIAKVYISAFLETTLLGEDYSALFRDYRIGSDWLPDTLYFNRYASGTSIKLASYEEDRDRNTLTNLGTATATGGLKWSEESTHVYNHGVVLEWDSKNPENPSYTLKWEEQARLSSSLIGAEGISISLADRSADLEDVDNDSLDTPQIEIELESSDGINVRLPLSQFMELQTIPTTLFTRHSWLEKHFDEGKYDIPAKPIFQSIEIAFEPFIEADARFNPLNLTKMTLYFTSDTGKVMLDEIALYKNNK